MIRTALVGDGVMGRRRASAMADDGRFALVGVADDADGARRLLDTARLDALVVCTPPDAAPGLVRAGLQRGLHVFCEKPPARSVSELDVVIAVAAERPGQRLMYGFNHRLHGSVRAAHDLIAAGALGALVGMRGVYGKPAMSGWRTDPAIAGGGILLDQGIHLVDLMHRFAGQRLDVAAARLTYAHGYAVEDGAWALLSGADGVVAQLCSSAVEARAVFRLELSLAAGRVTLDGILSGSGAYAPERLIVARPGAAGPDVRVFTEDTSWVDEMRAFGDAIRTPAGVLHGTSGDARDALWVVEEIYRQGRAGAPGAQT